MKMLISLFLTFLYRLGSIVDKLDRKINNLPDVIDINSVK